MAKSIQGINEDYRRGAKGLITKRYLELKIEAERLKLEILSKREFRIYSSEDDSFRHIYYDWIQSGFQKKMSPVIERIDLAKGFMWENLKWTTAEKKNRSNRKEIVMTNLDKRQTFYPSARKAEMVLKFPRGVLNRALRTGKRYKGFEIKLSNEKKYE